jgi:hypothetical protein
MTLVYTTPEADAMIVTASEWWQANRPKAPALLLQELLAAKEHLERFPETGRLVRRRGFPGPPDPAPHALSPLLSVFLRRRRGVLAMMLRYSHLSTAHQLDAVQRLNREPTATESAADKTAVAGRGKVVDLPVKESGGAWNRTTDLGIMRPSL